MNNTVREISDGHELQAAAATLLHLRPHYVEPQALADAIVRQHEHGYRLLGSFPEEHAAPAAVAGFRIVENLAWGRFLYVDDLVTAPEHRGAGHASTLLTALDQLGTDERCAGLHLDSGVGDDRREAHRRYFGHGMRISGYHFAKPLP